ncbi:MAG: hypothetical protein ABJ005_01005 [Alloalcanivorax venustensis]
MVHADPFRDIFQRYAVEPVFGEKILSVIEDFFGHLGATLRLRRAFFYSLLFSRHINPSISAWRDTGEDTVLIDAPHRK